MKYYDQFIVRPGSKVKLAGIDPDYKDRHLDKKSASKITEANTLRLRELQELLYAEHKRALLICLQAMDSGGKDGIISHVLGAMNPQGCRVAAFRQPTTVEADHDFLWRAHRDAPAKGEVVIFNRSHYEDVLVVRIHHLAPEKIWRAHYEQINAMEQTLAQNGTHILKFFLHISKDEQLRRFKKRLDDPSKHWKISESDYSERALWDEYVRAFEDAISKCSSACAPWFIIPANHKWFRDLAISQIMVQYMEGLNMRFPAPKADLKKIRQKYHGEAKKKKTE